MKVKHFIVLYRILICNNFMLQKRHNFANAIQLLTPDASKNDLIQNEFDENLKSTSPFEIYYATSRNTFFATTTHEKEFFQEQSSQVSANDDIITFEFTDITQTTIPQKSTNILQTSSSKSTFIESNETFSTVIPSGISASSGIPASSGISALTNSNSISSVWSNVESQVTFTDYASIWSNAESQVTFTDYASVWSNVKSQVTFTDYASVWSNVESQITFTDYAVMSVIEFVSSFVQGFVSTKSFTEFYFANENNTNIIYETVYDKTLSTWNNAEPQAVLSDYESISVVEVSSLLVQSFTNENSTNSVYETVDVTPSFFLTTQSIYHSNITSYFETALKEVGTSFVISLSNYNSDDVTKTTTTANINFSTLPPPAPSWLNTTYMYDNVSTMFNFIQFNGSVSLSFVQNVTQNESDIDVSVFFKSITYSMFNCNSFNFTGYNVSEYNLTWDRKCIHRGGTTEIPWYQNRIIYYAGGGGITSIIFFFILKALCSRCNKYSGEYFPPRHLLPQRRRNKEAWVLRHIDRFPNKGITT